MKKMFLLTLLIFLTGCATTELQTIAKTTRTISLSPETLKSKLVYLRVTGTEASILELEQPLREALQKRGVTLVQDPDLATMSLHINTLFADNLKEAANYKASLIGGGVAGGLAHARGNSSGDSILIGIGVALAMGLAEKALSDETYRAVIDVFLREKRNNVWAEEEKTRVLVEAVKMNLDKNEAKPIMEFKAVYQIAEILK
jgi:hypothetical protein